MEHSPGIYKYFTDKLENASEDSIEVIKIGIFLGTTIINNEKFYQVYNLIVQKNIDIEEDARTEYLIQVTLDKSNIVLLSKDVRVANSVCVFFITLFIDGIYAYRNGMDDVYALSKVKTISFI